MAGCLLILITAVAASGLPVVLVHHAIFASLAPVLTLLRCRAYAMLKEINFTILNMLFYVRRDNGWM